MNVLSYEIQSNGLLLRTSKGRVKLTPYSATSLRVQYTQEEQFSSKPSLMIQALPDPNVQFEVMEQEEQLILSTSRLRLEIDKATTAFTYKESNGKVLAMEPRRGGKTLVPIEVLKSVFDGAASLQTTQSADGVRVRTDQIERVVDRKAYHTKLEFDWMEDEALYGLGSHEEGIMNLRGSHQYLYQQNMKAVVPMLVSTRGYGILMDSYSLMTFHDDGFGSYLWTDVDDEMDFYFLYGPEWDQLVSEYRHLTGKAPMLPKWAFGYVQSKERYKTQQELIETVEEYRKRRIPLDLIVLDWCSWTGEQWGQKSLDPERFPDPAVMMDRIHELNAKLMVSIWPIMSNEGPNHAEMKSKELLLGNQATYDAFNVAARELYWKQANEGLFTYGIDAWWCDCTEPFEADWTGEVKPEPEERMHINTNEAKKYLDPEYINAYSLMHSKGIYEGQRGVTESKRVVNLTRSSYAGQQRYGTITWSGDTAANWDTLRKQIPAGLHFSVTGCPYWTTDIGGFFVAEKEQWFWKGEYDAGCEDLGYRELYVRWFQYGAFLPMFRSHGTDTPREVWRFGEPGSVWYDTLVQFIRLRYRLLPYIYSVSSWVTLFDYTMVRALPFDFRHDPRTFDIDDQFLFGPNFLVNPVLQPMYWSAGSRPLEVSEKSRFVYLPEGCDWYDFWTGRRYTGGQTIRARASLDTMPLFVRAGAIVPLGPEVQYTEEGTDSPIELRIYRGQNASFTYYEDAGDGYEYEKGAFATISIHWEEQSRKLIFGKRAGVYPGMKKLIHFAVVMVDEGKGCGLLEDGESAVIVKYDGSEQEVSM
ncbi:glycoside hydrolase [Paenibacillus sp. Soil766]|uniref:glycoside hydrolase family 31 protein n=1 Tax=Paenibacillus sp. Soil766 TaxID=1736404 RepID=UPI0007111B27|nr:TIM-barrel domain-containing protein [Paenibacillus sp. Soil766]KRF10207.1 glycoside hydrolase [Paenibacillus sp. Soil766]